MQLRISATSTYLGKPIAVEITYKNASDKALALEDPSTSLEVELHVIDQRTKEDLSYAMGKISTTTFGSDKDQYALVVPPPKRMEIAARSSFSFTTDLNERLYLRPGTFDCFATDAKSESNHVAIAIAFDRAAVQELLAFAQDERQSYARREWAMDWLAKLYPDFRLKLPLPDEAAAVRARKEADNKAVCAGFAAWWRQNERTPQMDEMLKRVQ